MFIRDNNTAADFNLSGKKFSISRKKRLQKVAAAKQIIKENDVCTYLTLYAKDINHILQRVGEPYVVGLEFDETKADNNIKLSKKTDTLCKDHQATNYKVLALFSCCW
jgi:hypothetical protein